MDCDTRLSENYPFGCSSFIKKPMLSPSFLSWLMNVATSKIFEMFGFLVRVCFAVLVPLDVIDILSLWIEAAPYHLWNEDELSCGWEIVVIILYVLLVMFLVCFLPWGMSASWGGLCLFTWLVVLFPTYIFWYGNFWEVALLVYREQCWYWWI